VQTRVVATLVENVAVRTRPACEPLARIPRRGSHRERRPSTARRRRAPCVVRCVAAPERGDAPRAVPKRRPTRRTRARAPAEPRDHESCGGVDREDRDRRFASGRPTRRTPVDRGAGRRRTDRPTCRRRPSGRAVVAHARQAVEPATSGEEAAKRSSRGRASAAVAGDDQHPAAADVAASDRWPPVAPPARPHRRRSTRRIVRWLQRSGRSSPPAAPARAVETRARAYFASPRVRRSRLPLRTRGTRRGDVEHDDP